MALRRARPAWARVAALALLLCGLFASSLWGGRDTQETRPRWLAGTAAVTTTCLEPEFEAFCQTNGTNTCRPASDFNGVCCTNEEACFSEKSNEVCPESWLCSAELIPGGSGNGRCLASWEKSGGGGAFVYILIMLFLFLGLAIVTDEYFVASLEKISSALELSEDVAGATFLAAGSSAPELFVSLADNVISNPPKSVGLGTIVGSAIFNILVIIGLSALLAGSTLSLNWRPLARDITFYVISVIALIGVVVDDQVKWYEAFILLVLYACYIAFMTVNARFFEWLDRKLGIAGPVEEGVGSAIGGDQRKVSSREDMEVDAEDFPSSVEESDDVELALEDFPRQDSALQAAEAVLGSSDNRSSNKPHVRHTVETTRPSAAVEAAAEAIQVSRRRSENLKDFSRSFEARSPRNAKYLSMSANPLHHSKNRAFNHSMRFSRDAAVHSISDADGKHSLKNVANAVIRANQSTWADASEVDTRSRHEQKSEGSTSLEGDMEEGVQEVSGENNNDDMGIPKEEEIEKKDEQEDEPESYWEPLLWPVDEENEQGSCFARYCLGWNNMFLARLYYVMALPFNLLFRFTVPDCSFDLFCEDKFDKEENRKIGYSLCFAMSIVWIAVLSHFLVYAASKFGCIVGISPAVMGLTLIAAGTSVPDAMSSIIVAKKGLGDMAIANSIGSNVFDILIGLGFPWLLANIIFGDAPEVATGDLWAGLGFLFGVVVALLLILKIFNWTMGRRVGALLISLYLVYIIFELVRSANKD